jgi:hypothetical protein
MAPRKQLSPHLIELDGVKRCSVCKHPFESNVKLSLSLAFRKHVATAHKPGQTTEDFSQAAVRIGREATENS